MAARSAALKLDWANVTRSLGLKGQTAASLAAFKARSDEVRRKVQQLSELPTTVDFAKYRATLNNQAVVDEVERRFREHRPAAYDVARQLKAIDAFEVEALRSAETTKTTVDVELKGLEKTLALMQNARPFEDMTVNELAEAVPWIDEQTEKRVEEGMWDAPGYKEKFGDLSVL